VKVMLDALSRLQLRETKDCGEPGSLIENPYQNVVPEPALLKYRQNGVLVAAD